MSTNYIFERYYFLEIICNALYKPETILKANSEKLTYHNFITRTDYKHIVHFFIIRNRSRRKYERDDEELKNRN